MCIAQVAIYFINNWVTPQGSAPGKLEPLAGKLAWAVLRGHGGSDAALLPDKLIYLMIRTEKIQKYMNEMESRGLDQFNLVPHHYRLLWKLGYFVRPPVFHGFIVLFISHFLFFFLFTAVGFVIVDLISEGKIVSEIPLLAVFSIIISFVLSIGYRIKARSLGLGEWKDF